MGLQDVGKPTLFNAITRTRKAESASYPFCTIDTELMLSDLEAVSRRRERVRRSPTLEASRRWGSAAESSIGRRPAPLDRPKVGHGRANQVAAQQHDPPAHAGRPAPMRKCEVQGHPEPADELSGVVTRRGEQGTSRPRRVHPFCLTGGEVIVCMAGP